MKISKYNSIIKIGCKNLLYNSLSDCFALAENTIINAIRNKDIHSIENSVSSTISTLKQGGFIIDDETNEQNILENLIKKIDYNENEFILTVNPTMNCNLKCWYCYENHQGNMYSKHSKKCTFYTLRFGCSFAAVNTIKPQLL